MFGKPAFCAASALFGAFAILRVLFPYNSAAKIAPLKVLLAGYRQTEPQTVTVSVDATKLLPAGREALETTAKKADGTLPPLPASYAAARTLGRDGEWFRWGRLADAQAETTVSLYHDAENPVSVYASAGNWGATALLTNRSAQTVTVRYRIRLGRGAYEMQLLRFLPAKPDIALAAQETSPDAANNRLNYKTRLIYLDGCDFSAVHTAERLVMLPPGETALVRANNVARTAVEAYYTAYGLLDDLRGSAPGPTKRLRKMLRDGEVGLKSLTPTTGRHSGARRLAAIHHLLLLTAQAQTLERNYLTRRAVKQEEGAALAAALEALSVALSQTSAVALRLVPQIEATPNERGDLIRVAISLRNGGTQSVDSVKLGLDNKLLPAQAVCQPPDPAYFGALPPGQSVETTFEVHTPSDAFPADARYTADVSYIAAACPAHLRPRSRF